MRFLGVLLATALIAVGCGSDDFERASATSDAPQLLSATINNLAELRSATLDAKVEVASAAGPASQIAVRGPVEAGEKGEAPRFALSAEISADGRAETVGVTYTGDEAFATVEGETYEVPSLIAGQLTAGVEEALAQGGPLVGVDLRRWVPDPVNAGVADVGGVETIKLTGRADLKRVVSDLNRLAGQLQSLQLPGMGGAVPKGLPADAEEHIQDVKVTVYTGAEDQVLRRLVIEGVAADDKGRALLDLTLTNVGEDQKIEAPSDAKPFSELLTQLGGAGGLLGG